MTGIQYPESFSHFLAFLCKKYDVDRKRVFIEYSSDHPPPIQGDQAGYYDGLLSYREKDGQLEFLITVFKIARNPMLTLGHEFAHLVEDLKTGNIGKHLDPPDEERERKFDNQAKRDINQFLTQKHLDESKSAL